MQIRNDTNQVISLWHDFLKLTGLKEIDVEYSDFVRASNFGLDKARMKIMRALNYRWSSDDTNNTTIPISTIAVLANQDHVGLADRHLKVRRFRIINRKGDYITLTPKDRRDLTDDELAQTGEPKYYDKIGMAVAFYPVPDYATTAEIEFDRGNNYFEIGDRTKEPGIPALFHRYISLFASKDAIFSEVIPNKINSIDNEIKELDAELEMAYSNRDLDDQTGFTLEQSQPLY